MKNIIMILFLVPMASTLIGQKYFTKTGNISFYSDAPMEKIEAHNAKASSVFDIESGAIEWAVLIKGFEFEKALMQEHFNENYMESTKFPKAKFKGKIIDISKLNINENGNYKVEVRGMLTIHGVEKEVSAMAKFKVGEEGISAVSSLSLDVSDYGIDIPAVVKDNIAKEIVVEIETKYQLFER